MPITINNIGLNVAEGYSCSSHGGHDHHDAKQAINTSELTIDQLYAYFESVKRRTTKGCRELLKAS